MTRPAGWTLVRALSANTIQLLLVIVLASATVQPSSSARSHRDKISIAMPDVRPDHADQYLCIAHRLPDDHRGQYIVGFNPRGDTSRVHHLLMFGCETPGVVRHDSPDHVWDCGQMHGSSAGSSGVQSYQEAPVCRGTQEILYGWAMNAPALKLPEGVGFRVGDDQTGIKYLVLQVHYGHVHQFQQFPDLTDNAGLELDMKPNEAWSGITRQAGVLLFASAGRVDVGISRHQIWCKIDEDIELHPFRFRVHTHKLGTKVLGAKVSRKEGNYLDGLSESSVNGMTLIGEGDPQQPQMFYPVKNEDMVIGGGDTVYAHCEFDNNNTHPVKIGVTSEDEMCDFYLMYWTDSANTLKKSVCVGENPIGYSFLSRFF